jgi:hypothetical protein
MFTVMTSLYKRRYDGRKLGAGNLLTEVGQGVKQYLEFWGQVKIIQFLRVHLGGMFKTIVLKSRKNAWMTK